MLRGLIAVTLISMLAMTAAGAAAQSPAGPPDIAGVFLTTKYPALTVRRGEPTTIDLAVRNFKLPPQQLAITVAQAPQGWKATILGGGQPVGAVLVGPDSEERLQLRLEPPPGTGQGEYQFAVAAKNARYDQTLPITLLIGEELPAKLKMTTNFPALRGTPTTSFKYRVTVTNDSGRDATVNLSADAPRTLQISFSEAYGSQQITSIPIEAGKSKDVEASVTLPRDTQAGEYKLALHAKTEAASADLPVTLTLVGQPRLAVTGEGGRLSGEAYSGQESQLNIVLRNDGTEAARDVEMSATTPEGWKSAFEPKLIPQVPPGGNQIVKVSLTPSAKAIAGDYQTTIRASGANGVSDSANFRITVLTSTLWGAVAIAIIAISLLVVVFSVARFGRR